MVLLKRSLKTQCSSRADEDAVAVGSERKKLYAIIGGPHYLQGQTKQIAELADTVLDWLDQPGLRG